MPHTYTNEELWQFVFREKGQTGRWDVGCPPPNQTFPIEPNHPLLVGSEPMWDGLRLKLLEVLQESSVVWSSLSLLRRRPTVEPIYDDHTTVVIVIGRDTTPAAETHLYQKLCSMCLDEGHLTLRTELIRGESIRFTNATGLSYDRQPIIGSSLGVKGVDWAAGTLGVSSNCENWMLLCHVLSHVIMC